MNVFIVHIFPQPEGPSLGPLGWEGWKPDKDLAVAAQ